MELLIRGVAVFGGMAVGMERLSEFGWLEAYSDFSVRGPVYFAVTLVAIILAHDTYYYWTHRAMHHPRLFRRFPVRTCPGRVGTISRCIFFNDINKRSVAVEPVR